MAIDSAPLPRILFFSINGAGLGHLSRCLAYARRMQGRAQPVFFSLASAIEIIHDMGFEADYFVCPSSSRSHINAWNRESAVRFGLMLEEVRPAVAVFDGTWPFQGFMDACDAYGVRRRVWSNRLLHKPGIGPVPVEASAFDVVIEPGELGAEFAVERAETPGRKVTTAPVLLLADSELLNRDDAREALGLEPEGRYALFSLGAGNLNDIGDIARGLIAEVRRHGLRAVWARVPITLRDVPLPDHVLPISAFPLARFMRAFDAFVGASGYNTSYEVLQSRVPSLLVPNTRSADDQARRAALVARQAPVIVSTCETREAQTEAVRRLLSLSGGANDPTPAGLDGAAQAADEILALVGREAAG